MNDARTALAGSTLHHDRQRVLWALRPVGGYGGNLTAERIGSILGDPENTGCTIGTARAKQALDQLIQEGLVVKAGQSYRLNAEAIPDSRSRRSPDNQTERRCRET